MPQVACRVCLKKFYTKPSHQKLGWGKYCSTFCRSRAQCKGQKVTCHVCKKEIYRSPKALKHSKSGKFFCSKSCQTLWRNDEYVGEKSSNWKNGERAYRNILKRSGRRQVCALCENSDMRVLTAHHKDHQRYNNVLENLVWLCLNCHYLVHHDHELDKKVRSN